MLYEYIWYRRFLTRKRKAPPSLTIHPSINQSTTINCSPRSSPTAQSKEDEEEEAFSLSHLFIKFACTVLYRHCRFPSYRIIPTQLLYQQPPQPVKSTYIVHTHTRPSTSSLALPAAGWLSGPIAERARLYVNFINCIVSAIISHPTPLTDNVTRTVPVRYMPKNPTLGGLRPPIRHGS